ncbi:CPBP family intramembrane metalloprotease [Psychrobacillus sp. AK 1817]|nr:CPBP family intramembrane metalloprotease [Psychrobacillus sp. AK 1817]
MIINKFHCCDYGKDVLLVNNRKLFVGLIISLLLAFVFCWLTFSNEKVFWYFYSFTTLFLTAGAFYFSKIEDQLRTFSYLFWGIVYGVATYLLFVLGYQLLDFLPSKATKEVSNFLGTFAPTALWHYILLFFIIIPGEELFWRGFIQVALKNWLSPTNAIIISSILYGAVFIASGFYIGVLAAIIMGVIFGLLYEKKKSMPLNIVAHIVLLLLLFLVLPII